MAGFFVFLGLGSIYYIYTLENPLYSNLVFDAHVANQSISIVLIGIFFYKFFYETLDAENQKIKFDTKIYSLPLFLIALISFSIKTYLLFQENATTFNLPSFDDQLYNAANSANSGVLNIYLAYFANFNYLALSILTVPFLTKEFSKKDRVYFFVLIFLSILFGILVGKKEELLKLIIFLLTPYSLLKLSSKIKIYIRPSIYFYAFITIMLIFVLNPIIRLFISSVGLVGMTNVVQLVITGDFDFFSNAYQQFSTSDGSFYSSSLNYTLNRIFLFNMLLPAVYYTPQYINFMFFQKYVDLIPFSIIPRAIWKNKPTIVENLDYTYNYLNGNLNSATSPSYIGWGYLELGIFGVILTMFILALISVFIKSYSIYAIKNSILLIAILSSFNFHMWSVMGYFFGLLSGIPTVFITSIIFFAFYHFLTSFLIKIKVLHE